MKTMIKANDIVRIKPQWQDKGDSQYTWIARNDEEKGRVDISALELRDNPNMPIWPMWTVSVDMLDLRKTLPEMEELARAGRCIDEADYCSVRQQDAENLFWLEAERILSAEDWDDLCGYTLGSTIDEGIDFALKLLRKTLS